MKSGVKFAVCAIALAVAACIAISPAWWFGPNPNPPVAPVAVERLAPSFHTPPATPDEASKLPEGANFGYSPDRAEIDKFLEAMPHKNLRQAGPELFEPEFKAAPGGAVAEPESFLLYRPLLRVNPGWSVGRQGIGDCVGWGHAHACDILLGIRCDISGGKWEAASSESAYGGSRCEARGKEFAGWSDGSYGSAAVKWLKNWGVVYRKPYNGLDLTTYSASLAKDWGAYGNGGKGDNGKFDLVAKQHPIKTVSLVVTYEEARAALRNGYPVTVCSNQGFSSRRDQQGFASPSGSWKHCMVLIGVRDDRPGCLCLNSWGTKWITGPKWPSDQPDGSFWIDERTINRMLSGRDCWALSDTEGFVKRTLRNAEGW